MIDEHPETGGDRINLVAHQMLIDALDAASAPQGISRAHFVRQLLADRMRADGFLAPDAPASKAEARRRRRT
ncbi:hypothetical protein [Heyndrickxia sporothermodurans]